MRRPWHRTPLASAAENAIELTWGDLRRDVSRVPIAAQPAEFAAQTLDSLSFYETMKANGGIVLSSKIFERLNPALSLEWDKVKATLRM